MFEPDYTDTLNNMANLEDLTKFVVASNTALEGKRSQMVKLLVDMQSQVGKIRDQIESIKNKGTSATTEIKQLIKDADTKQGESLKRIKSNITSMIQMDELENTVKNLEGDINTLAGVTTAVVGSSIGLDPGSGRPPAIGPATLGGYTYGKSRRKGKGRRKRTKKSRKKGSYKYSY